MVNFKYIHTSKQISTIMERLDRMEDRLRMAEEQVDSHREKVLNAQLLTEKHESLIEDIRDEYAQKSDFEHLEN